MLEKTSDELTETEALLNTANATSKVAIATMSQDIDKTWIQLEKHSILSTHD